MKTNNSIISPCGNKSCPSAPNVESSPYNRNPHEGIPDGIDSYGSFMPKETNNSIISPCGNKSCPSAPNVESSPYNGNPHEGIPDGIDSCGSFMPKKIIYGSFKKRTLENSDVNDEPPQKK